jgi:CubicO group peptidase (beta-lactamase class C family)
MKDGQIAYTQGYGLADLERETPNLPSTVFNIGSMAKQFTAFALLLLEDEGKLSLDDDLRQHLPEMHDFGQTITLRHLIHHTSGLRGSFPELLGLAEYWESDVTTTDDVFRLLKAQRELNFRPGDEYLYVNSNYVLLALICERVSGQSLAAFTQERIFDPLGMTRSTINDSIFKLIPGRACGYYEDGEGGWLNAVLADSVLGPTNVYTTVEDLAAWDENLYSGKVGGLHLVERMHQPGRLNDGTELDYAFGLEVGPNHQHRGYQMVEHGGGQGGYGAWMVRFPELHLSVVVLFNHFLWEMRDYALKVADLFLEEIPPKEAESEQATALAASSAHEAATQIELSEAQLQDKVGKYFSAERAAHREVTFADGRLQYLGLNLLPLNEHLFVFEKEPDSQVEFVPGEDGRITALRTIVSSGVYDYDRVETISVTPDDLTAYAGRYYSPELDIYWVIRAENDHLVASRRKYADSKLSPLFADAFSDDWLPIVGYPTTYLVVFERDERGAITGLRVSGTRVRNLRFIKQGA